MRRFARHCVGFLSKPPVAAFLVGSTLTTLTIDVASSALIQEAWFARVLLLVGILFMGFAVLWTLRLETKRNRTAQGLCPACGYDLRASPGRCRSAGPKTRGETGWPI